MKKTFSMMLALVMIFALTIPAFAEEQEQPAPGTKSVDVAGAVAAPTITVEVPSGVTLTLNPYQMKYNGDIKALKDKQDQILSTPAVFVNKSDGKLQAELTATATIPSGIEVVDDADDAMEATDKTVYLTMQFGMVTDKTGAAWVSEPDAVAFANVTPEPEEGDEAEDPVYQVAYTKDGDEAVALEVDATDGKNANYFAFSFGGAMSTELEDGALWDSQDAITVAVVLTLSPINDAPAAVETPAGG